MFFGVVFIHRFWTVYIRRYGQRSLALALILLLLPPASMAAVVVDGVGQLTSSWRLDLSEGTFLSQNTLKHNEAGLQEERILEWTPGSPATPMVTTGGAYIGNLQSVPGAAAALSSQSIDIVAGLNGSFYDLSSGVPMGLLVTEGIIRSGGAYSQALGFTDTGRAFINECYLSLTLTAPIGGSDQEIAIGNINHVRTKNGLYLYTPDFGTTTKTTSKGTHIVIDTYDDMRLGKRAEGRISAILSDTADAAPLMPGRMVLSCRSDGPIGRLDGLEVGMEVTLSADTTLDQWQNCLYIISGYQRLLTNGGVAAGLEAGRAPRTAVGVKPDGTCVFYVVDGRQSGYSTGLSLTETAARLRSLGCTDAINFDGGGSSTIGGVYPGTSTFMVLNKPSDGVNRKVANMIFLVNRTPKTDIAGRLHIYRTENGTLQDPGVWILQGGVMQLGVRATDTNAHPITAPSGVQWETDDAYVGQISQNGFFTALAEGEVRVTALGGGVAGLTDVRVTETLTSLQIKQKDSDDTLDNLVLQPGQIVELAASGLYDGEEVLCQNACFAWTLHGDLGTVDNEGRLTATTLRGGAGYLVVSGGGLSKTIPVSVGHPAEVLEDFEDASQTTFAPGDAYIGFSAETDRTQVKYGLRAGRISYRFETWAASGDQAELPADLTLPNHPPALVLWLKGDGSRNILSVVIENELGEQSELIIGALDSTAYRRVSVTLPADAKRITAFKLTLHEGLDMNGTLSGMFYLDQITAAYDNNIDTAPPVITLQSAVNDTAAGLLALKAQITDNGADAVRRQDISLLWNGQSMAFTYDPITRQLTASLPLPAAGYHRLCLEASDPSGNRARMDHVIQQPISYTVKSFFDIRESWAAPYIDALDGRGLLTAKEDLGLRYFQPADILTREQFAIFMARALGVDLVRYENVNLPYEDLDEIPTSAIREIKAMYALSIIQGRDNNGKLVFDPYGAITRADFMTIVGRSLPRGFTVNPLQGYSDASTVPAYALEHVEQLTSLGVVAGYPDATLRPLRSVTREEAAKMLFFLY